jgi:hypothetical protein
MKLLALFLTLLVPATFGADSDPDLQKKFVGSWKLISIEGPNQTSKKKPLNNADSARISTLTAMLGRKSIYERRVITWEEVDV